jgi:sec-independent protein translocase protein TatB
MLDIAWPELVVIGVVALVAIGPKDLPKVMHAMGKWAGKARDFTQDMRRAFEQASYESEMTEKAKTNAKTESSEKSHDIHTPPA